MDRRSAKNSSAVFGSFHSQENRRFTLRHQVARALAIHLVLIGSLSGCLGSRPVNLPDAELLNREQLRIHHDFDLPTEHRLLMELTALRGDLLSRLQLRTSDEPIHIYLFEDESKFRRYVAETYPEFPVRRAFFTRSDTTLKVFAYWGELVGDDLRHETTHAYLHSVVPQVPLWLDEGLAEYFELPRGSQGFQPDHLRLLARQRFEGTWTPDLDRLENLASSGQMRQIDYAEAWLWTHFLISRQDHRTDWLAQQFAEAQGSGNFPRLSLELARIEAEPRIAIETHLAELLRQAETSGSGS